MQSTRDIKKRIRSVKNISQITKAMEVVSATKMRRSQEFALRARPYAVASLEMMQNLLMRTPVLPNLLMERKIEKTLVVVVTSDKGLAGAFNANILRKAEQKIADLKTPFSLVTVGKKARDYFAARNTLVDKSFWDFGDYTLLKDTLPVAEHIIQNFIEKKCDEVYVVYTNFRTTLRQETMIKKVLPATFEGISDAVMSILPEHGRFAENSATPSMQYSFEYKFEPSPTEILEVLALQLLRMHIHHIILESNASEHSARMVAMKNASENAKELITGLSLQYNKTRQAGITRELTEITAGKEALEG